MPFIRALPPQLPLLPSPLLALLVFSVLPSLLLSSPTNAQIVPDNTLGAEQSQIIPFDMSIDIIGGGAQRGQNLFHSFAEFNIGQGRGAYFFSPDGVGNIFSRVTGNNPSTILGTLGTFGDSVPDLFFMNPNGVLFGPSAFLDVEGSLAVITADEIQFNTQGVFSATNPEQPSELLTIDPSAFFFSQAPIGNGPQFLH
ncbi:MAG: filamentous hemagglutinin N-terminal domain-containing protein [Merismopedia sp. SIO2A8]|nr:filamentous hemagglutinin N-terminal domain-containing protein [Merismopedia sp. SIO2A8]